MLRLAPWRCDEEFWALLFENAHKALGGAPPPRFDEYCNRIRALPRDVDEFSVESDGQVLLPHGRYPDLHASAIHDSSQFSFTPRLEAATSAIRAEVKGFVQQRAQAEVWSTDFFSGTYGDSYSGIALARRGELLPEAEQEFPETTALLTALGIDGGNRLVHFARQAPFSGVESHSDGLSYLLTGHLGIQIPANCSMEINGELVLWQEGQLTIVQNSFRHHTINESPDERILLYFDFWHPALDDDERAALSVFEATRREFEAEQQKRLLQQPEMAHLSDLVERMHKVGGVGGT